MVGFQPSIGSLVFLTHLFYSHRGKLLSKYSLLFLQLTYSPSEVQYLTAQSCPQGKAAEMTVNEEKASNVGKSCPPMFYCPLRE